MTATPFMTHSELLAELDGQAYVVLRPSGSIEALFRATHDRILERFPGLPVTSPNSAHVTIRGYPEEASWETIGRVVARWAEVLSPIMLTVEKISVFEAPSQVVILQIEKTPELRAAFTRLSELSQVAGLPYFETAPWTADAWTFHVSVLYGRKLDSEAWARVHRLVWQLEAPVVSDTVTQAELVHYRGGHERIRLMPFGRASELSMRSPDA